MVTLASVSTLKITPQTEDDLMTLPNRDKSLEGIWRRVCRVNSRVSGSLEM